ncbi:TPA: hypothetical protein ONB20_002645 [Pseudomonas aeruginosa]|nr:hypothetical protein [Pseudomonas aeruginosa]
MFTEPSASNITSMPVGVSQPVVKSKAASRPTVIYCFTWAAGSGGVYVGKRTPPAHHNVAEWPTSGTGRLPCGYGGSGNVIRAARAKHPEEAFSWRILEVVPAGGDYAEAEARWVAWAKENHPEVCRNLTNGGDGWDSEASRKLWENPAHRAHISESMSQAWERPEYRERISGASRQPWEDPAYRARASEQNKLNAQVAWGCPEFRERMNARRSGLQKRLASATKRLSLGQPPLPLDNLCLETFGEPRNPLPCVESKEPRSEVQREVLEALRQHPEGLAVPELCTLLGRPETGAGGVRNSLGDLRKKCFQPIINEGGIFVLLSKGEY